ncbi:hypothetical protein MET9862_05739 [Methylobacterium symbioticum]|uniref:Uncharacterized protein n=1 Tax=Methylobacterium symbioticum TaxID=2584084 RepID=A0A509EL71_9HYPH|nr:hypothetical protein MET9862_05739 [Methylobacterium symbioticum]
MKGRLTFRPPWTAQPYSEAVRPRVPGFAPTIWAAAELTVPALISCTAAEIWAEPQGWS